MSSNNDGKQNPGMGERTKEAREVITMGKWPKGFLKPVSFPKSFCFY